MEDLPALPAENYHRIRLRVDIDRPDIAPVDVLSFATLKLPRALPLRLELALFARNTLLDSDAIDAISAVRAQIKAQATGGGAPADSAAVLATGSDTSLDNTLTAAIWRADTGAHASIDIAATAMAFAAPAKGRGWLIISAKYAAEPDVWVARSFAPIEILETGQLDPST